MFLRSTVRKKNGKEHEYFSIVENKRVAAGKVVQRHVLYLGEINSTQQESWRKTIEIFEDGQVKPRTVALFPADRTTAISSEEIVRIRLQDLQLKRPRQWGACWLTTELYEKLELDRFWAEKLPPSRKGTRWDLVLQTLVTYRLLDPGSEWKLHRQWFETTALADLLGADFGLAESHKLYECLDRLLPHKAALFAHLTARWKDLFNAKFEVLLYDLTSTYFESDPPFGEMDKRKFGYSRDKRPDCVQVVIALVVTPEGFPLAYEVMPGNTSDKTTLPAFLKTIEAQYGKAQRIWIMDRGIPTKKNLQAMRESDPPIRYLVGTPKGSLTKYEKQLTELPWQTVRAGVEVKLLKEEKELFVLAQSGDRRQKERAMRRRQLKDLWRRLKEIQAMKFSEKNDMVMKLGAAKQQSPSAWRLVEVKIAKAEAELSFTFSLRKKKFRQVRQREGRYLLRSNLVEEAPAKLWHLYIQLTQVEEAFKNLKGDLALRPLFHKKETRIEAHIFVAFLAYCLHVTLKRWLRDLAPGLTPRSVLDKFRAVQMIDVHLPTTDGREVILNRYTQPEKELQILLTQLKLQLPDQPPPKITAPAVLPN
jgi:Transposase DDE domain